jgi:hypothetical protein
VPTALSGPARPSTQAAGAAHDHQHPDADRPRRSEKHDPDDGWKLIDHGDDRVHLAGVLAVAERGEVLVGVRQRPRAVARRGAEPAVVAVGVDEVAGHAAEAVAAHRAVRVGAHRQARLDRPLPPLVDVEGDHELVVAGAPLGDDAAGEDRVGFLGRLARRRRLGAGARPRRRRAPHQQEQRGTARAEQADHQPDPRPRASLRARPAHARHLLGGSSARAVPPTRRNRSDPAGCEPPASGAQAGTGRRLTAPPRRPDPG